jgi:hypothetical protein
VEVHVQPAAFNRQIVMYLAKHVGDYLRVDSCAVAFLHFIEELLNLLFLEASFQTIKLVKGFFKQIVVAGAIVTTVSGVPMLESWPRSTARMGRLAWAVSSRAGQPGSRDWVQNGAST